MRVKSIFMNPARNSNYSSRYSDLKERGQMKTIFADMMVSTDLLT